MMIHSPKPQKPTCLKAIASFAVYMLCSYFVSAQYAVKEIPAPLLEHAHLVKRLDDTRIEIKNPGKAYYYRRYIYTILDEAADDFALFVDRYDRFQDITNISGTLYDAAGTKIKTVKKKDISEESGTSAGTLADDARYKIHSFYHKSYPYTVEYEVEIELKGLFSLPEWQPLPGPEVALEKATFTVLAPKDYQLRYQQLRYEGAPLIKEEKSTMMYQWQVYGQPATPAETFTPHWDLRSTRVLVAPSQFEFGGYQGDISDWQGFGKFMQTLYQGRDVLPADVKAMVHHLTDTLSTDKQKVQVLYLFMQDHTHYISIQLGIGGWQPLDANYVATKKYGDCKALSNYMIALLKEAGIKAHNAFIKAGANAAPIVRDFPSNQFNHVIVCVPGNRDTTWLECTSQTVAPGYMGSFTGDRDALVVADGTSTIVHTPRYLKAQNLQIRHIKATISEAGTLHAKVTTKHTGLQQDELHAIVKGSTREDQKKRLQQIFALSSYEVPAFTYFEDQQQSIPTLTETLEIVSNNYASVTGRRLFVRPNIIPYTAKLAATEKRTQEISYPFAFIDEDSIEIEIPEGYTVESLPPPVSIQSDFGSYAIQYEVKGTQVLLQRSYQRNDGVFATATYEKFVAFYNQIYKADQARMVFVKQE